MKIRYIASLHSMTQVPHGSIWRGNGTIDFIADATPHVKEVFSKVDGNGKVLFKKPGFVIPTRKL